MKIELPDIPYELLDTLSSAEVPLVRAYARHAIREFVESQRYEGWLIVNKASGDRRVQKTCVVSDADTPLVNRYPLIIKPELDDADA